jgi:hypothetical protein
MKPLDLNSFIIWEDDALLVLNKPPGAASAPFPGVQDNTVTDLVASHLAERGEDRGGLAYRLKPWVSGALLWLKTEEALSKVKGEMARGDAFTIFICLVAGSPGGYEGELSNGAGRWVALNNFSGCTVLEIRPGPGSGEDDVAGALMTMGTPLVGPDGVSPPGGSPFERRFIHCQRVEFPHPDGSGGRGSYVAPFPRDIKLRLAELTGR